MTLTQPRPGPGPSPSPVEHRGDTRVASDPTAAPEQDSDVGRQYYYVVAVPPGERGVA